MGNVFSTCFGYGLEDIGLFEKRFSRVLLASRHVTFIDLRSEEEFLAGHLRGALHLPAAAIGAAAGEDDCKTFVSQTYKQCGLRDVLEYYSQPPFEKENTSLMEVVFYTAQGKGSSAEGNDQMLMHVMEHKEYLRGMASHCYALEDGYNALVESFTDEEKAEMVVNTKDYRSAVHGQLLDDENVSEIVEDYLFLGSTDNASDDGLLKDFRITHLLNVSNKVLDDVPEDVKSHHVGLSDVDGLHFLQTLPAIFDILVESGSNKVLLFCKDGLSQSVAVAIGYLMKRNSWSLRKAFFHVVEQRPCLLVQPVLMRRLMEMEAVLFPFLKECSLPIGPYLLFFNRLESLSAALTFMDVPDDPLPAALAQEAEGAPESARTPKGDHSDPSHAEAGVRETTEPGGVTEVEGSVSLSSYSADFASEDLSAATLDSLDGD